MVEASIRGERRAHRRYPIELDLQYKIVQAGSVVSAGAGKTENMSSVGILLHVHQEIQPGACVELSIRWPALSPAAPFLQLWGLGHVTRSDPAGTALRISRYQFQKLGDSKPVFDRLPRHLVLQ